MDDGIYFEIFAAKEGKRINLKIVSFIESTIGQLNSDSAVNEAEEGEG